MHKKKLLFKWGFTIKIELAAILDGGFSNTVYTVPNADIMKA